MSKPHKIPAAAFAQLLEDYDTETRLNARHMQIQLKGLRYRQQDAEDRGFPAMARAWQISADHIEHELQQLLLINRPIGARPVVPGGAVVVAFPQREVLRP